MSCVWADGGNSCGLIQHVVPSNAASRLVHDRVPCDAVRHQPVAGGHANGRVVAGHHYRSGTCWGTPWVRQVVAVVDALLDAV